MNRDAFGVTLIWPTRSLAGALGGNRDQSFGCAEPPRFVAEVLDGDAAFARSAISPWEDLISASTRAGRRRATQAPSRRSVPSAHARGVGFAQAWSHRGRIKQALARSRLTNAATVGREV